MDLSVYMLRLSVKYFSGQPIFQEIEGGIGYR